MKSIIHVLLVLSLSGCATAIPLSYRESCAVKGLALDGVDSNDGEAAVAGSNGYARGVYSGENVRCTKPKDDAEKCEINALAKTATPKLEYNENLSNKRLLNGIGYVLWIIPGVVAKVVYDGQRSEAINQSRNIASSSCH